MVRKKKVEGALWPKLRIPRSIPTFQKLSSVLLKDMDKKEKALFLHVQSEAAEVNVAPLRLQWSQLKARAARPYSRYKHICILKPLIFLLWLYNIPWWPDLAAECYTESWRDIKIKEEKKNKQTRDVMKLSVVGGEGEFDGESCLLQFVGLFVFSLVPFLKCYTRWSNTHSSSIALLWHSALRTGEKTFSGGWSRSPPATLLLTHFIYSFLHLEIIKNVLPMSASWLCCKVNPQLCSCSELFPRLLRMFCPPGALQIWSGRLPLGRGFLQQRCKNIRQYTECSAMKWIFLFIETDLSNYRETSCPESSVIISSQRLPIKTKKFTMKLTFLKI